MHMDHKSADLQGRSCGARIKKAPVGNRHTGDDHALPCPGTTPFSPSMAVRASRVRHRVANVVPGNGALSQIAAAYYPKPPSGSAEPSRSDIPSIQALDCEYTGA